MSTKASEIDVAVNDAPYNEIDDAVSAPKKNTAPIPEDEYPVLCCSNSAKDLAIIFALFIFIWGMTAVFFIVLLVAALATDDTSVALWVFGGMFVVGVVFLGLVIAASDYDKKLHASKDASEE